MKRATHILSFAIGAGATLMLSFLTMGYADSQKAMKDAPVVSSVTASPMIPSSIIFCGDTIDLTRYQTRESMDRELSSFPYYHSTTMLMLKRANRYFPIIEPILREEGVPDDFKYLAVIESHLNANAVSSASAVGPWQLMAATAKQYGLTVTSSIDERRDIEKSTRAACKYLKGAYAKFGNWVEAAASYNAGMGRISSELTKQQADSYFDLWLVEETTRYVFRIMAIKQIFENPYKYGFVLRATDLYKPIDCRTIEVKSSITDLASFAKKEGITYSDLKRFNPFLRDRKLPITSGKAYSLRIPKASDMHYADGEAPYVHNPAWIVK